MNSSKSCSDDDEELAALRMAALATLKSKPQNNDVPIQSQIEILGSTNSNQDRPDKNSHHVKQQNMLPRLDRFRQQDSQILRRRGIRGFQHNSGQRSNLIVITPVSAHENSADSTNKPLLVLPQHRWCQSGNEDSSSPKSFRRTGPSRFNRHESDSDNSDSEFDKCSDSDKSDDESNSSETFLQDEQSQNLSSDAIVDNNSRLDDTDPQKELNFSSFSSTPVHESFQSETSSNIQVGSNLVSSKVSSIQVMNSETPKDSSSETRKSSETEKWPANQEKHNKFCNSSKGFPSSKQNDDIDNIAFIKSSTIPVLDVNDKNISSSLKTPVEDNSIFSNQNKYQKRLNHDLNCNNDKVEISHSPVKNQTESFEKNQTTTQSENQSHKRDLRERLLTRKDKKSSSRSRSSSSDEISGTSRTKFTRRDKNNHKVHNRFRQNRHSASSEESHSQRHNNRRQSSSSNSDVDADFKFKSETKKAETCSTANKISSTGEKVKSQFQPITWDRGNDQIKVNKKATDIKFAPEKNRKNGVHQNINARGISSESKMRRSRSPVRDSFNSSRQKKSQRLNRSPSVSSSFSSSSSSSSPRPKIRSVSSVVLTAPPKVTDSNNVMAVKSLISSGTTMPSSKIEFKVQNSAIQSTGSAKNSTLEITKRVPVHMRLGKRVIQMTKDVEAAFRNTSSDDDLDVILTSKKPNIQINVDLHKRGTDNFKNSKKDSYGKFNILNKKSKKLKTHR